ncbi:MAG: thiamine phosphate synthase [Flavobacteriaceae bacterium]|nr:MAG: thiamine phosphate synthase [Flavobacteriaceae bacterium]
MLIVISSEAEIPTEAMYINQLFALGMSCLHLRKPMASEEACRRLINTIDTRYHQKIMLHQHYGLCSEFGLKGIHLKEVFRRSLGKKGMTYVNNYQEKGFLVTSSFHSYQELESCALSFDYFLLSPVFDSISKKGYKGVELDVTDSNKYIVGLGGISIKTIAKTVLLGYKGVAVLGAVWENSDPVSGFKELKICYQSNNLNL